MEADKTDLEAQLRASLNATRERGRVDAAKQAPIVSTPRARRRAGVERGSRSSTDASLNESVNPGGAPAPIANGTSPVPELYTPGQMTLRQKLGEVRRRIGYVQK